MTDPAAPPPPSSAAARTRSPRQKRPVKVWLPPTVLTVVTWIAILLTLVLPMRPIEAWPPDEMLLLPDGVGLATLLLVPLFMPLGFFEGWTGVSLWRPGKGVLVIVLLDAIFLSGVAEVVQWFLIEPAGSFESIFNRDSSLLDMLVCVCGSLSGGVVALLLAPRINRALWGDLNAPAETRSPA